MKTGFILYCKKLAAKLENFAAPYTQKNRFDGKSANSARVNTSQNIDFSQ
jgi:hypothetical protein